MHFLRQDQCEATLGWNMELQVVQEDSCRWCLDSFVSSPALQERVCCGREVF